MNDNVDRCIAALQNQKAVSAYFASKQILPFSFAGWYYLGLYGWILLLCTWKLVTILVEAYKQGTHVILHTSSDVHHKLCHIN